MVAFPKKKKKRMVAYFVLGENVFLILADLSVIVLVHH